MDCQEISVPYKNKGGRPREWTDEIVENEADALIEWIYEKEGNIILELFTYKRGYTHTQIYDWIKRNSKFREAYKLYKEKQKGTLFAGGLNGQFRHQTVALMLSANHGVFAKNDAVQNTNSNPVNFLLDEVDGTSADLIHE